MKILVLLLSLFALNAFAEPPLSEATLKSIRELIEAKGIKVKSISVEEKTFSFEGHEQARVTVVTENLQRVQFSVLFKIAHTPLVEARIMDLALNKFLHTHYFQLPLPEGKGHENLGEVLKKTKVDLQVRIKGLKVIQGNAALRGTYFAERVWNSGAYSLFSLAQMELLDPFFRDKIILKHPTQALDPELLKRQMGYLSEYKKKMAAARSTALGHIWQLEREATPNAARIQEKKTLVDNCNTYIIELELTLEALQKLLDGKNIPDHRFEAQEEADLKLEVKELERALKTVETIQEVLEKNRTPDRWFVAREALLRMAGTLPKTAVLNGLSCRILVFAAQLAHLSEEVAAAKKHGVTSAAVATEFLDRATALSFEMKKIYQEADRYKVSEIRSPLLNVDPAKPFAHMEILGEQVKMATELVNEARSIKVRR